MRADKYDDGKKTTEKEVWWKHPGVILFYLVGSPLFSLVLNRFGLKDWIEGSVHMPDSNTNEVNNIPNIIGTASSILIAFTILAAPIIWQLIANLHDRHHVKKHSKSRGFSA